MAPPIEGSQKSWLFSFDINYMKKKYLNFKLPLLLTFYLLLTSCAVNQIVEKPNGEVLAAVRDVNYEVAKNNAVQSANQYCSNKGGGVNYLRAEQPYDNVGVAYYLYFNCFSLAAQQAEENKRQEIKRAEEAKRRAIDAEKQRQAEIAQRNADREWERTRPQREAEARRRQEAENRRLNSICFGYYIARQLCANAPNYQSCMEIRYGKNYSYSDDQTCYRR